jgi:hypothetical protein
LFLSKRLRAAYGRRAPYVAPGGAWNKIRRSLGVYQATDRRLFFDGSPAAFKGLQKWRRQSGARRGHEGDG